MRKSYDGGMKSSTPASNFSKAVDYGICGEMLTKSMPNTSITYWDLALLLPNVFFLIFLCYHMGLFHRMFHQKQFPLLKILLILIFLVCVVGVIRGFVSIIVASTSDQERRLPNEILWLLLRFLLMAVEISVIGFGLFSGSGRSAGVGKRVLSLSFFVALVYTSIQSSLEFLTPKVFKTKFTMFHHGGMMFWSISSTMFFLIYSCIVILPTTNCLCGRGFLSLPSNRAFYRYAAILCLVNLVQSIGSLLVYYKKPSGLCILNVSVLVYYSLFALLIYFTFLQKSFRKLKDKRSSLDYGSINNQKESSSSKDSNEGPVVV